MTIQIPSLLLDGVVLAFLKEEELYGYVITKKVQEYVDVSESTIYPVLRRLKKNGFIETYDVPFEGRMRRYYKMTGDGTLELERISKEWLTLRKAIDQIIGGKNESLSQ